MLRQFTIGIVSPGGKVNVRHYMSSRNWVKGLFGAMGTDYRTKEERMCLLTDSMDFLIRSLQSQTKMAEFIKTDIPVELAGRITSFYLTQKEKCNWSDVFLSIIQAVLLNGDSHRGKTKGRGKKKSERVPVDSVTSVPFTSPYSPFSRIFCDIHFSF